MVYQLKDPLRLTNRKEKEILKPDYDRKSDDDYECNLKYSLFVYILLI